MYRFLRRPAWIVSHVLVLALIVAMINLGLWQLRRLDEKQDRNRQIEQNTVKDPLSVDEAVAVVDAGGAEAVKYRPVASRGSYDADGEVAIRGRSFDGAPGRWVATPFLPDGGGDAVMVVRGWIPEALDDTDMPVDGVEPPTGEVSVTGYLMPTQTKQTFGSTDPPTGTLSEMARVDVARIDQQYAGELVPFWLQLSAQDPPTPSVANQPTISPVPLPALDEGPHLAYAFQWGVFTLIAILGYPMILRRVARQRAREGEDDDDGDEGDADEGEGDDVPRDGDAPDGDGATSVEEPVG